MEELAQRDHKLYFSLSVTKMRSNTHGVNMNECKILVGKSQGKRTIGGPARRWNKIRMDR
jgi:hypothetical protein